MAKHQVSRGVDPDVQDADSQKLIHLAYEKGHQKIAEILLSAGKEEN